MREPCRFCGVSPIHEFLDLGSTPLCESYVPAEALASPDPVYPLMVSVCPECFLVQLPAHVSGEEIFSEYAYFSSYSESWLAHAERFATAMQERFRLGATSRVVEVASNDGYLLQYFLRAGIPSLGIEPAQNVARAAEAKGIPTLVEFFGRDSAHRLLARDLGADLLIGNNVLAQVPDLNDFVAGLSLLLRPGGVLTLEFPHMLRLVEGNQFDTIYHEHYSYFSLFTTTRVLGAHGLAVFDVEELSTHGGSLRIFAARDGDPAHRTTPRVADLLDRETEAGITRLEYYADFARRPPEVKQKLLALLAEARDAGKQVAGYGAPGKGNTLLNYCGIGTDLIAYTVDRNPYKQGKYLPGSRIPVLAPERLEETRPDYVLILPWNLQDEIMRQLDHIRSWGGRFIVPIPTPRVYR